MAQNDNMQGPTRHPAICHQSTKLKPWLSGVSITAVVEWHLRIQSHMHASGAVFASGCCIHCHDKNVVSVCICTWTMPGAVPCCMLEEALVIAHTAGQTYVLPECTWSAHSGAQPCRWISDGQSPMCKRVSTAIADDNRGSKVLETRVPCTTNACPLSPVVDRHSKVQFQTSCQMYEIHPY